MRGLLAIRPSPPIVALSTLSSVVFLPSLSFLFVLMYIYSFIIALSFFFRRDCTFFMLHSHSGRPRSDNAAVETHLPLPCSGYRGSSLSLLIIGNVPFVIFRIRLLKA